MEKYKKKLFNSSIPCKILFLICVFLLLCLLHLDGRIINLLKEYIKFIMKKEYIRETIIPLSGVFIASYLTQRSNAKEKRQEALINTSIIYKDISSKIQDIQNYFRPMIIDEKKSYQYAIINSTAGIIQQRDTDNYLPKLSDKISIFDVQVIRYFYTNYELNIVPINKKLMENGLYKIELRSETRNHNRDIKNNSNESIFDPMEKSKINSKIEFIYNKILYNNQDIINLLNKLRDIIIEIERKKFIKNFFKTDDEIFPYLKVDLKLSINDLNKDPKSIE